MKAMSEIEFFFDLSSPWTRLAFHNIQPLAAKRNVTIRWRPMLLGGVFNAVNPSVYAARENPDDRKFTHGFTVLPEWAELAGVRMNFPSEHHPVRSVHAMRCCCVLEDDQEALHRFATAAFEAYFGDQRNLDDPEILTAIANETGFDGAALLAQAQDREVKDRLRADTQEAIDRGAYGSPSIFVPDGQGGERLYFGNDQLPLVAQALDRLRQQEA